MSDWMHWFGGWAGLILGFSGLIFIHELGHFALAKWNGVKVYVFSLGMGPYLLTFTWRGTVYALSMIPIGGYVKMMGQDDMNASPTATKDESDYRNKRPGQKAAILAAGAAFNLIFTLVIFAFCYGVGMDVEPPRIGNVIHGKPIAEAKTRNAQNQIVDANLQKGDLIIEVNGMHVKTFVEAQMQIAGAPTNEELWLKVERQPAGSGNWQLVTVKPRKDKSMGAPGIGLEPYVYKMQLPLGFSTSDKLVVDDYESNKDTQALKEKPAYQAGIRKGDQILSVSDKTHPGSEVTTEVVEVEQLIQAAGSSEGRPLTYSVLREGKRVDFTITPVKHEKTDNWIVGLLSAPRREVVEIDESSEAYTKGLRKGNFVIGFDPDDANPDVWKHGTLLWKKNADGKEILKMELSVPEEGKLVFTQQRRASTHYRAESIGEAIATSWDDTVRNSTLVFSVIRGLITGDVGKEALSGALGIGNVMFQVARSQKFMNFLWLLGLISLNLGVLQFVPIPLLDGWHLVMLGVEKLKGSPVAPKIQEAFLYIGLFIVGGLLLLATYNDIKRMFM